MSTTRGSAGGGGREVSFTPKARQKCGIPAVSRNFGPETGRTERIAATVVAAFRPKWKRSNGQKTDGVRPRCDCGLRVACPYLSGHDLPRWRIRRCLNVRRYQRHPPQTICRARRHPQESGSPVPVCRRATARSIVYGNEKNVGGCHPPGRDPDCRYQR